MSFDFAIGIIPGWHATIFPPYFVAGAIYAGFAMVLTLAIPLRVLYGLEDFITMRHLENMGKVMLVTGLIVAYGYVMEAFFGWYSANQYEQFMILNRMIGPYWPFYWALILCNIVDAAVALDQERADDARSLLFVIAMFVNVGMWLERFVIVVTSLHRDFLPSSWGMYWPTRWDWMTFFGTIGLFVTLFFLFIRVLPMISIFEMRTMVPGGEGEGSEGALSAADAMDHTPAAPALYGVMAEFEDPTSLVDAARRTYDEGYRTFDSFSPFPIHEIVRGDAPRTTSACRCSCWSAGIAGLCTGPRAAGVGVGVCVSAEHRRPPVSELADVHPGHLRADDPVRGVRRGVRDVRAERAADAVSPGVQRRAVRGAREPGPVLPRDRGDRSEVRPHRHARVSAEPRGEGHQ